jgi:sensor histidine kinase YesM
MQMEQLRFEKGFEYEFSISEHINTESILIPPLLLQPFVENAIWHGLMPKSEAGKIVIRISSNKNELRCVVEDNGVGRERAKEINAMKKSGHQSLGMRVTEERIEILKQQKNLDSKVEFTDLKDTEGRAIGTKAEIILPLEYSY